MKATLTIEIDFDPNVTDVDSVGEAVDTLLETAMSTPGILDEYGNPGIGQTYILKETVSPRAFVHMADGDPIAVYLVPEDKLPSGDVGAAETKAAYYSQSLRNIIPYVCERPEELVLLVQEQNPELDDELCEKCGTPFSEGSIDGGRCLACGSMICAKIPEELS